MLKVAANGDTANKIGTYQMAVVAKHHGVPFYIAAPLTSIDLGISCGDHITIEERPDREMTHVGEHRIAAPGKQLINFIIICFYLHFLIIFFTCRYFMLESSFRCDTS